MRKFLLLLLLSLTFFPSVAHAQEEGALPQEEVLEGRVVDTFESALKVVITSGSLEGREVEIPLGDLEIVSQPDYAVGDLVVISKTVGFEGEDSFFITDFVRRRPLIWLFAVFVVLAVLIGGWHGSASLLSLIVSFLVVLKLLVPQILVGRDPVLMAVLSSLLIVPVTFFLSHGFNRKTLVAVVGSLSSLLIVGLIARFFVGAARITGFSSDEAGFLFLTRPELGDLSGLVLAGIIVSLLGILDDVTVDQAATVAEIRAANPDLSATSLFRRAMRVGRDHIASMVNTLVLVYAGASLPLLLLFVDSPLPFSQIINYEVLAEEIVRTLVGSIGLILAVPLTTGLACVAEIRRAK